MSLNSIEETKRIDTLLSIGRWDIKNQVNEWLDIWCKERRLIDIKVFASKKESSYVNSVDIIIYDKI